MKTARALATATLCLTIAGGAFAHDGGEKTEGANSYKKQLVTQLGSIEEKLEALAAATPADKFDWRPSEGIRSVGEVYLHVAASNYFLLSFSGVKPPEGVDPMKMEETIHGKENVIKALKDSAAFAKEKIEKMTDADLEKAIKLFGQDTNVRYSMMIMVEHRSEHLGQSIAYARSNGIAPPWSK